MNSKVWNKYYCQEVIEYFCDDNNMQNFKRGDRRYKRYIIKQENANNNWVWNSVDDLIKANLGENYFISTWLIGLRYDVGDYFEEHTDGYSTGDRYLSGGIELSQKDDYSGGIYTINGVPERKEQGHLFVHNPLVLHEITKVTKGTRFSLHFCVGLKKVNSI